MHNPNSALLFAGPVLGIDPVVTALLTVEGTLVEVDVVDVVEVVEVVSADEAADRPIAEWALPVDEAWFGKVPDTAAAAVPTPSAATVAMVAALAVRTLVSNISPFGMFAPSTAINRVRTRPC